MENKKDKELNGYVQKKMVEFLKQTQQENAGDSVMKQSAMTVEDTGSGLTEEDIKEILLDSFDYAGYYLENGSVKFADFFREMVTDFGDGIRPFVGRIYLGMSYLVSDDIVDLMDDAVTVRGFDINTNINTEDNVNETNKKMWHPVTYRPMRTVTGHYPRLELCLWLYLPVDSLAEARKMFPLENNPEKAMEILEKAMEQAGWDLLPQEAIEALKTEIQLERNPELEKELSPLVKERQLSLRGKLAMKWKDDHPGMKVLVETLEGLKRWMSEVQILGLYPWGVDLEEEDEEENEDNCLGMDEWDLLTALEEMMGKVPEILIPYYLLPTRVEEMVKYRSKLRQRREED